MNNTFNDENNKRTSINNFRLLNEVPIIEPLCQLYPPWFPNDCSYIISLVITVLININIYKYLFHTL